MALGHVAAGSAAEEESQSLSAPQSPRYSSLRDKRWNGSCLEGRRSEAADILPLSDELPMFKAKKWLQRTADHVLERRICADLLNVNDHFGPW
ncbi:hypothetical protein AGIG_G3078 [Arapaima gigas]